MDGIILINKEKNYTSHDIVAITKKALNEKVGHTGTLDPNATGVLPLLIGNGTKLSKYLINHDKIYIATLKLGIKTDTADKIGNILEEIQVDKNILNEENIRNVLQSIKGKQEQFPPMYSAIKVNGKKLYEYARKGQTIEVKSRQIEIYDIELEKIDIEQNKIIFIVKCSKGTYIRTLCEDIAQKLGTIGCMEDLERVQVGIFNIKDSIKIDELKNNIDDKEFIKSHFIKVEDILKENRKVELDVFELKKFLNGVKLKKEVKDGIYNIYSQGKFLGTAISIKEELKRDIIF